jgi:hypothetical protein
VFDFLLAQGTSASAKQYSIQVIHAFISFFWGPSIAQALQKGSGYAYT